jgi:GT2 family glycosyltransferase
MNDDSDVLVSVVVVTDPYREDFRKSLVPFLEQSLSHASYELVLVDFDRRPALAPLLGALPTADLPRVVYVQSSKPGRAALNNLGVAMSRAPLLVFCGEDFVPGSSFVESHLAYHLANPELTRVGIGGGVAPEEMRRRSAFLRWLEDSGELFGVDFRRPEVSLPQGFFYVANASLKRAFFDAAGGFDERLPFPAYDDVDFGERLRRLGMVSAFIPGATCIHDHFVTLEGRREQLRQAGSSAAMCWSSAEAARPLERTSRGKLLRHWLRLVRRDGPRTAYWRFTLRRAYSRAVRRQLREQAL